MGLAARNFILCNPRMLRKDLSYDALHKKGKKVRTFARNWRSGQGKPLHRQVAESLPRGMKYVLSIGVTIVR